MWKELEPTQRSYGCHCRGWYERGRSWQAPPCWQRAAAGGGAAGLLPTVVEADTVPKSAHVRGSDGHLGALFHFGCTLHEEQDCGTWMTEFDWVLPRSCAVVEVRDGREVQTGTGRQSDPLLRLTSGWCCGGQHLEWSMQIWCPVTDKENKTGFDISEPAAYQHIL